jgi:heme-degrading monooxygenase HmoA
MIARTWQGWATPAKAGDYRRHFETDVAAHLRAVPGFRGARLLSTRDGDEVRFTTVTFFESMDAVRGFAGDSPDLAVLEEDARRALRHWDERVTHHEVLAEI